MANGWRLLPSDYSTRSGSDGINLLSAVKMHALRLVESSIPSLPSPGTVTWSSGLTSWSPLP